MEANLNPSDPEQVERRKSMFPGFNYEDKVFPANPVARLVMLIKKEIEYERKSSLENEINCIIVINIKKSKKGAKIVGVYRQWTGTSGVCNYNGKDRASGLKRFKDMINVLEEVVNAPGDTTICVDFNLDRLKSNNPESRNDIKFHIPIFEEFNKIQNRSKTNNTQLCPDHSAQ